MALHSFSPTWVQTRITLTLCFNDMFAYHICDQTICLAYGWKTHSHHRIPCTKGLSYRQRSKRLLMSLNSFLKMSCWAFLEEHTRSKSIYNKVITGYHHTAHDTLIVHAFLAPSPFIQANWSIYTSSNVAACHVSLLSHLVKIATNMSLLELASRP